MAIRHGLGKMGIDLVGVTYGITILTDPMPLGAQLGEEYLKRATRRLVYGPSGSKGPVPYRGHPAVTRSLIKGLAELAHPFTYNPNRLSDVYPDVVVLSGIKTLRQALRLKRNGKISRIYAGPNIVTFSSDANGIIADEQIHTVLTPSTWVSSMYFEDHHSLQGHTLEWPAGVDHTKWAPSSSTSKRDILFYIKGCQKNNEIDIFERFATEKGYSVKKIIYGSYSESEYLNLLHRSKLMVVFAGSESQGIAWQEAWATDTPTLIQSVSRATFKGREYSCSAAPYLTPSCGMFFDGPKQFESMFTDWHQGAFQFHPRAWLVEHLTDKLSAQKLLAHIEASQAGHNRRPHQGL